MGKVKKPVSSDKKIKKATTSLSTIKKSKTTKNARKNLGAIPSYPKKPLKVRKDIDADLTKSRSPEKCDMTQGKKKKMASVNEQGIGNAIDVNEFENQSKSKINKSKIAKKLKSDGPKEDKMIHKVKKAPLKNGTHAFKVKTALIFNPKFNQKENIVSCVNVDENTVRSGIIALFKVIENKKSDKSLFADEVPIFLHFSCIKMGKSPSRTLRIPLKHSLLKDTSEVCLITDDTKGFRKEFEKSIEYYEEFLKERNVTNIKTIMPFYQLKNEYSEFELKRKLVELYDAFLVDAKVCGYVVKKLGRIFMEKRKLPVPIRLTANKLKENIDFALRKTSMNLYPHSDNFVVQIGHSEMSEDAIYDNFQEVCGNLATHFPGGWGNIRGLNLKTPKSMAIPVYYSMKKSSEVPVPVVKAKRPKAYKVVKGELSTAYDKEVKVLPTGDVILKEPIKSKKKNKPSTRNKVNGTANGFSRDDESRSDDKKAQKKIFRNSKPGKGKIKEKILNKLKVKTKRMKDSKKSNGKLPKKGKKVAITKSKKIKPKKGNKK